ncbi:putative ATP synthase subunit f, mitochondrial [Watersipora subatra]|uniref:putative ATP synthase subunit f, mitochondrial n=1 Tax=Watersipora subatra TaxID=2589382 RepID=UPI00355B6DEE
MLESIGRPPPEYNPYVHGPYDPGKFYGNKGKPWQEVKLAELPSWLTKRSANPIDWTRSFYRAYWRYSHRWLNTKKIGSASIFHVGLFFGAYYYFLQYRSHTDERRSKYHW